MAAPDLNKLREDIVTCTEEYEVLSAKDDKAKQRWSEALEETRKAYSRLETARERFLEATKDVVPPKPEGIPVDE